MTIKRPKLLYFITEDWYFFSHRLPIARAAKQAGFDVVLLARTSAKLPLIEAEGIRVIPLDIRRGGTHPLHELAVLWKVLQIYRRERPCMVHQVAMKPVLYGSLAAHIAGIPVVINALAGLGFVFASNTLRARLLRPFVLLAWRFILKRPNHHLVLQNHDDADFFAKNKLVTPAAIHLIRGSGVNIQRFRSTPQVESVPLVMLVARMLKDKGILEFVEASRLLRQRGVAARFVLVGGVDNENPAGIPIKQLRTWQAEGVVEWWEEQEDMPAVLAQAQIACLPSYREGLPKSLLEAAACGLPIVATDVPGCREIVRHDENGLLVPPRDVVQLAAAIERLIGDLGLRQRMGNRGREIVVAEFSEEKVVADTLAIYEGMLGLCG